LIIEQLIFQDCKIDTCCFPG